MLLTKLVEPEVRSVVIHRLAVPLNEQAVGIYPLGRRLAVQVRPAQL